MSTTIDRILELMQTKGINAAQLHTACGLDNSATTKWKSGRQKPSAEALVKIADYFEVSTDYLLVRTDNPHPSDYIPKNNISYKTLTLFEKLTPNETKVVDTLMESLIDARE